MTISEPKTIPLDTFRFAGTSVVDELEAPIRNRVPTKKRRGRPPASKTATSSSGRELKSDEFAYLRARLQGLSAAASSRQYLPQIHPTKIDAYESELRERLKLTVATSHDSELKAAYDAFVDAQADVPEPAVQTQTQTLSRPSLEQFAERFPDDMYSEAELIDLYEEEDWSDLDQSPPGVPLHVGMPVRTLQQQIDGLHFLQRRFTKAVTQSDPVRLWFSESVSTELAKHEVHTVADLAKWVNRTGTRWHKFLVGVGRTRASRMEAWLSAHEEVLGVRIENGILTAKSGKLNALLQSRLMPLEELVWPSTLTGAKGTFRAEGANALNATTDRQAVFSWLNTLSDKSATTKEAYFRAIERLSLWALLERQIALSSITTQHLNEFLGFLLAPPPHWVGKGVTLKSSSEWRPMRSAANLATIRLTLSAVGKMFKDWTVARYLTSNPVSTSGVAPQRKASLKVGRSFGPQQMALIKNTLDDIAESPSKNRLRALILLLKMAGVSRSEACAATWKDIAGRDLEKNQSAALVLVVGKGGRARRVPLHPAAFEALSKHREDRLSLIQSGKLSTYKDVLFDDTPLLSILDERLARPAPKTRGDAPHNSESGLNLTGSISPNRVNGILKEFFRAVARTDPTYGNEHFARASPHWFRHTFGHAAAAATGNNIASVQALLGHATHTAIGAYVTADAVDAREAIRHVDTGL